eukprot:m.230242 g.230242  ORF g.230242 m.230242 type:complete len:606 (-) comp18858_c1_seq2:3244-5061(-)
MPATAWADGAWTMASITEMIRSCDTSSRNAFQLRHPIGGDDGLASLALPGVDSTNTATTAKTRAVAILRCARGATKKPKANQFNMALSALRPAAAALSRASRRVAATPGVGWTRTQLSAFSSAVPHTPDQAAFKHLQRDQRYSSLNDEDVRHFEGVLDSARVVTDQDDIAPFNQDWMGKFRGSSQLVLKPRTTEEVSAILSYCNRRRLAVVPQGGNTGLVGGSVPVFDEIVLSTSLMNNIISMDELAGILQCQAGCVLQSVDNYLQERGFIMPLDLGAKGSCQIGGNVSTNAGGLRLLRYGSLHGSVLGLEAVLADGTVCNTMAGLRKDNTGYDLKQLFIGSEGTLGVVTGVTIQTPPAPKTVNVSFLGCDSYDSVLDIFRAAKGSLGEILSAFEFLDTQSMDVVRNNLDLRNPLEADHPFYVLIETHGSNEEHDQEKLFSFLETGLESGLILDGTVAQDSTQAAAIWDVRESLGEGLKKEGTVYKYDISLPLPELYSLVEAMRDRIEGHYISCVGYGHVGDGNLHLNITSTTHSDKLFDLIEPFIYEFTSRLNGSISAEHGVGLAKPAYLHYSKSDQAVGVMQSLKALLDPNGILNPYKTLPSQ